jgi:hypothetical protein
MNKQAQLGVGTIIVVAIAIMVGLVFFASIADNVDQATRTNSGVVTASNTLIVGVLNTNVELTGQELVSVTGVTNRTGGETVSATNYTISECVRASDNLKGICYKATGVGIPPATGPINVSYTYYPNGYIDDAGARSVTDIIILLTALGIAFVAYLGVRTKFD